MLTSTTQAQGILLYAAIPIDCNRIEKIKQEYIPNTVAFDPGLTIAPDRSTRTSCRHDPESDKEAQTKKAIVPRKGGRNTLFWELGFGPVGLSVFVGRNGPVMRW